MLREMSAMFMLPPYSYIVAANEGLVRMLAYISMPFFLLGEIATTWLELTHLRLAAISLDPLATEKEGKKGNAQCQLETPHTLLMSCE